MPLIPEEPQIHESVPGPRATPAAGRTAPTPRPVPGPGPRPAPPRGAPAASARPGKPGPSRGAVPGPPGQRTAPKPAAQGAAAAAEAQLQLIPAPADGAVDAADEAVDLLLDSGRAPSEVLVLTTGDPHPWATHELSFGEASYWAQHDAADDVFYADAGATRAKGRPVVVVAVNGGSDETVAQALPAAMARAGALLIVCGDPQRINALIGATA
ncbi:hypothetical protein C3486_10730 [Streptomyces sp. Ru73]|uniref:hypothetical protein n=1 Tax=Streptomyces sp. Ru73 TaxID=2080748 RepID=UPI000CDD47F0|nr:hypothetical protein [Streptomyces sp. Ru73]POX41050.1 hypothetical protein C3486_10730 [Streptomyces sp. Ru73]